LHLWTLVLLRFWSSPWLFDQADISVHSGAASQGALSECMIQPCGRRIFLPRPAMLAGLRCAARGHHFPRPAADALLLRVRIVARLLWSLHAVLREGFSRDMLLVLSSTYPAALLSDIRHFCTATFADITAAMPKRFGRPPMLPPATNNLNKFVSR
jgi:hypothetical protein